MMRPCAATLCAALCFIAVSFAQPRLEPRIERLDSGLKVVILEDHSRPLVNVQLWLRAGSARDDFAEPGACELVRRVLESRATYSRYTYADSRTSLDACVFLATCRREELPRVITAQRARLEPRPISEDEFRAALAARPDSSAAAIDGLNWLSCEAAAPLLEALYTATPYAQLPGRVSPAWQTGSAAELEHFRATWLVPGNATLFVYGDIDAGDVVTLVRSAFSGLAWAEASRAGGWDSPPPERIVLAQPSSAEAQAGISRIDFAWSTPPESYFENAAIDVLFERLLNPVDGSLRPKLAAMGVGAIEYGRVGWRDGGVLVLSTPIPRIANPTMTSTSPARANPDAIASMIEAAINDAASARITEVEFNRARRLAERSILLQRDDFGSLARRLGFLEAVGGDVLLGEYDLPRVRGVCVPDVRMAAISLAESRRVVRFVAANERTAPEAASSEVTTPPATMPADEAPEPLIDTAPEWLAFESPIRGSVGVLARPGCGRVTICSSIGQHNPATLEVLTKVGTNLLSDRVLQDWLSYRGIDLAAIGSYGICSSGPAGEWRAMVELHARLLLDPNTDLASIQSALSSLTSPIVTDAGLARIADRLVAQVDVRSAPAPDAAAIQLELRALAAGLGELSNEAVRIMIAGDVDPKSTAAEVAREWRDRLSGVKPPPTAPIAAESNAAPLPRILWFATGDDSQIEVRVCERRSPLSRLSPRQVGCVIGVSERSSLGQRPGHSRWRVEWLENAGWVLGCSTTGDQLAAALVEVLGDPGARLRVWSEIDAAERQRFKQLLGIEAALPRAVDSRKDAIDWFARSFIPPNPVSIDHVTFPLDAAHSSMALIVVGGGDAIAPVLDRVGRVQRILR